MASLTISNNDFLQDAADCFVLFVEQDCFDSKELALIENNYFHALKQLMDTRKFTGKAQTSLLIPILKDKKIKHVLCMGIGKKNDDGMIDLELYRRVLGRTVRVAEQNKFSTIALRLLPSDLFGLSDADFVKETVITTRIAQYHFDRYITDETRKMSVKDIILLSVGHDKTAVNDGLKIGMVTADAVNLARTWIDAPPIDLTPPALATVAKNIARDTGLKITVFNEKEIKNMGMGGLSAVSSGSEQDCQFVVLEYDCGVKDASTLGFVGKGITFDSGGLSLKPANYMETMKEDMSGAAAVIAAMQAIAHLKPRVNVCGFAALSENLPSGKAIKPGDIITFYNGKTAEIKNTDAEGRLVLADALSYAEKHYDKLDLLVDLATLTGACAYALGPYFSGLMSKNEIVIAKLQEAAHLSGDSLWRLPLTDDYKAAIKSPIADMQNIGGRQYMAGATTAGLFLENFVQKTPWAHIDIAGTAFNVPDIPYYRPDSATGVGVRLLIELATNWVV